MIHSNSISITGNIRKDPEIKAMGQGYVCNALMVHNRYDKKAEFNTAASWFNLEIWGNKAENFHRLCPNGAHVLIHGNLRIEEYDKSDGSKGVKHKITVNAFENLTVREEQGQDYSNIGPKQDDDVPF